MWKGRDGDDRYAYARTLDVSETGLRIQVPEPVPERSYVIFRGDSLALHGTASVRSCQLKGVKYVVGLEFSTGMKWKPDVAANVKKLARALEPEGQPEKVIDPESVSQ